MADRTRYALRRWLVVVGTHYRNGGTQCVRSGMAVATVAGRSSLALLFRVLPACPMSRFDPLVALREGSRGTAGGRRQFKFSSQCGTSCEWRPMCSK
jgi:hypothetical protein